MNATLITGGSRGIGRATAILLAPKGHQVIFTYRSQEQKTNDVVNEIHKLSRKATAIKTDISDEKQVIDLFTYIDNHHGRLTGLVNNVGILKKQSSIENLDSKRLQTIFSTNVIGAFLCAREAVNRMAFRYGGQGGCIVNVSSVASQ